MDGSGMDLLDLRGRVAVVTGAASGQGRATALRLPTGPEHRWRPWT